MEDKIKMDLQDVGWGAWIGFASLRVGQVAGCCKRGEHFEFHKMRGIP